jgi:hypothetical protein
MQHGKAEWIADQESRLRLGVFTPGGAQSWAEPSALGSEVGRALEFSFGPPVRLMGSDQGRRSCHMGRIKQ